MRWEGNFGKIAFNNVTGMTYDGHGIDWYTGELADPLHYWSAASKESIQLMMMARALDPSPEHVWNSKMASIFLSPEDPANGRNVALSILKRKITTLQSWNKQYPGFGGFLPWFYNFDTGLIPANGWNNSVPALDNGEMIWGFFGLQVSIQKLIQTSIQTRGIDPVIWSTKVLSELDNQLASYLNLLSQTAVTIFYAGNGLVRSVTDIYNTSAPPTPDNYWMSCTDNCYLDDPYEGEMFAVFLYLYSTALTDADREMIWVQKRPLLQAVDFKTSDDAHITVQRGWWFSSHEQWKYLELPYQMASSINNRVFLNGERARTIYSNMMQIAGMHASVTDVVSTPGELPPDYLSATGIQSIAFENITDNNIVTPYSAFPTLLANWTVGLTWYLQMLQAPRMQNPFGSTESINISATAFSPVLTWDSKITTLCAILGGISDLVADGMMRDETYTPFGQVIDKEWLSAFPTLSGEDQSIQPPQFPFPPSDLGPFSSCQ